MTQEQRVVSILKTNTCETFRSSQLARLAEIPKKRMGRILQNARAKHPQIKRTKKRVEAQRQTYFLYWWSDTTQHNAT